MCIFWSHILNRCLSSYELHGKWVIFAIYSVNALKTSINISASTFNLCRISENNNLSKLLDFLSQKLVIYM